MPVVISYNDCMHNTKVQILLILPFFYPHRGGSQKYAEEILARLVRNHTNVKVDVLCYNTDHVTNFEEYRGFRVYRVPCWNVIPARFAIPNPISLIAMLIKLSKNKYNFVNTHIRFFDPTWWVWAYADYIGAKSFFTGHVAIHPIHQNKIVEIVSKTVDLTLAKLSLKFYDLVTFTNKTAQKFFVDKLGVTQETHIVYGGVDTTYFSPVEKRTERKIPNTQIVVSKDKLLVTFVGRMIWTKGVTYLYDSIKPLLTTHGDKAVYVLAGPGELELELKERIKRDGLESKIIMTGNLSYEQVRDLLVVSDIFVNPSHHNEGFPNTILEAGASGCFVIATDNAGTWEVIRDKETGLLIPQRNIKALTEALKWSFDNEAKRNEISKRFTKELVSHFDWNIISEQLYHILLGNMDY